METALMAYYSRARPAPSPELAIRSSALFHCKKRAQCESEPFELPTYFPPSTGDPFQSTDADNAADFTLSLLDQLGLHFGAIIVASGRIGSNPFLRPREICETMEARASLRTSSRGSISSGPFVSSGTFQMLAWSFSPCRYRAQS
jgi:hypothetical protein